MSQGKLYLLISAAVLLLASVAGAANLTVVSPGLGGGTSATCPTGCKLAVNLTSDTVKTFVISDHPTAERVFRMSFHIDINNLTLPTGTAVRFVEARKDKPNARIVVFVSAYFRNGKHKMRVTTFNEDGSTRAAGGFDLKSTGWSKFEVELVLASGLGTNDGSIRIIKGTNIKGINDWDLYLDGTNGVDQVRFGLPKNPSALLNGTFYLDEFESFRSLAP